MEVVPVAVHPRRLGVSPRARGRGPDEVINPVPIFCRSLPVGSQEKDIYGEGKWFPPRGEMGVDPYGHLPRESRGAVVEGSKSRVWNPFRWVPSGIGLEGDFPDGPSFLRHTSFKTTLRYGPLSSLTRCPLGPSLPPFRRPP